MVPLALTQDAAGSGQLWDGDEGPAMRLQWCRAVLLLGLCAAGVAEWSWVCLAGCPATREHGRTGIPTMHP